MDFLYFSVTTQTLVGFGDIAPVHPVARALSVVQQLVGLFFAMVIVSMTLGTLRAHKAADARNQRLSRRSSTGGQGTRNRRQCESRAWKARTSVRPNTRRSVRRNSCAPTSPQRSNR